MAERLAHSASVSLLRIEERVRFPFSPSLCGYLYQAHKSNCMFNKLKLKHRLAHFC